ncbi:parallel beta-helix repeat protein [Rhizobium azibense]|uniref:Parallel beta-helix repeat protein n=1 Tax=Rhizobium azibense TaxID=1136135 RepID=A0A4R3QJG1_9HYPH|nr:right-handed parallel beta-helix repeat-containing protein [Rhizobium azibense]TCU21224.1 parallel beta-helix repeat protein [Rhizobium azibense]
MILDKTKAVIMSTGLALLVGCQGGAPYIDSSFLQPDLGYQRPHPQRPPDPSVPSPDDENTGPLTPVEEPPTDTSPPSEDAGQSTPCGQETISKIRAPGSEPVSLRCNIQLSSRDVVTRQLIFEGSSASNAVLDCGGGLIDVSSGSSRMQKTGIVVRSTRIASGQWDAPRNVTIRNCRIRGFVRIYGLGENANGEVMKASSLKPDHTTYSQAAAPANVRFEKVRIEAPGGIPFYVGPGVTGAALISSQISGRSTAVAVYLDAESARNTISGNVFSIKTDKRELIAIDGSARNTISRNTFENSDNGGIFVYRNCGEGGVIRHQKPEFNQITQNTFRYSSGRKQPAVWLGSRNGGKDYCFTDPAYPFGSSASNADFADNNNVEGNRIVGGGRDLIVSRGGNNVVRDNTSQ